VKVKLDENLPADLATDLRQAGHDVADVVQEGLGGEPAGSSRRDKPGGSLNDARELE
jgi:Domain of unknown function (DUF5615)